MKAFYKNQEVEVWRITKEGSRPQWVSDAFGKNELVWLDDRLRILMPALYPKWAKDDRNYGYGMYAIGNIGDVIDLTNGKVVSQSTFERNYRIKNF